MNATSLISCISRGMGRQTGSVDRQPRTHRPQTEAEKSTTAKKKAAKLAAAKTKAREKEAAARRNFFGGTSAAAAAQSGSAAAAAPIGDGGDATGEHCLGEDDVEMEKRAAEAAGLRVEESGDEEAREDAPPQYTFMGYDPRSCVRLQYNINSD